MAGNISFDIVSEIDMQEMDNAINQTRKEISQRYDFKGSIAEIDFNNEDLKVHAQDEFKLESIMEVLKGKMIKSLNQLQTEQLDKLLKLKREFKRIRQKKLYRILKIRK